MRRRVVLGAAAAVALLAQLPAAAVPQSHFGLWLVRADGTDARKVFDGFVGHLSFAWSPDGALLAYGNGDIWVLDVATGDRKNVTAGDGWELEPAWSPDGTLIAYRNGTDVWVSDADGSAPMQLTEGSAFDALPSWSPSGDLLSFQRSADSQMQATLHVMEPGGGPAVGLVRVEGPTSWSPDGREIAYRGATGAVSVVDVATGEVDELVAGGSLPAWEPSGDRIAYVSGDGLYVVSRREGAPTRLVEGSPHTFGRITWSPDGRALAFVNGGEVFVVDVATGDFVAVTDGDGTDADHAPLWSPAGDLVAFVGVTYCCWDTRWDRSIEAEAARHLVVRGDVDAAFPPCAKHVPLGVSRRRDGGWVNLGDVSTGRRGGFRLRLPDRPGRYRVLTPRVELEIEGDLHTCSKASLVVRHSHRRSR